MKKVFLIILILLAPLGLSAADKKAKQPKQEKPKQEKLATLYKNARNAIKNLSGQDAAKNALLGALARPELNNKQKAKIYYSAAQLEESLNAVENRKAFLKQAYDTAAFFNKLCDMYGQLRLCDSVDLAPDAQGNTRPRMQKKTNSLRNKHRRNILGGGKYFLSKKNYAAAYPFFDNYCTYTGKEQIDTIVHQAELWATLSAFQVENYNGTIKHVDKAIDFADAETAPILQEYKARSYSKLGNDSAWVASLKQGIQNYPKHDWFFVQLSDWYQAHRNFAEERNLADELTKRMGDKAIYMYAKSKSYLSQGDYSACIAYADSTIQLDSNFADAYYNKGISYLNLAVISQEMSTKDVNDPKYAEDKQRTQELYRQAQPCMEMVRKLQPDRQDRWASPLYRIYLNLNLGDEFNEIDRLLNPKQ